MYNRFAEMRRRYLREHRDGIYTGMLLTGKLDEKKDFMFVVTDDQGASYQFSIDSTAEPEWYDEVAGGESVAVTYTGALSEVDPFECTIASVEKVK